MARARAKRVVVCGTDFSRASAGALASAAELARDLGAGLERLHAVPAHTALFPFAATRRSAGRIQALALRDARERMRRLVAALPRSGVVPKGIVRKGNPDDALLAHAGRRRAAYLVVGTHGLGVGRRMMLGSTALRVLAAAPCPVLVVPSAPRARRRTARR